MVLGRLLETVLRAEGAALRAGLVRLGGDLDAAEDALQEAALRALQRWPVDGIPDRPAAWLNTVARRWLIDRHRRGREQPLSADLAATLTDERPAPAQWLQQQQDQSGAVGDDRLRLLFQVCHPALAAEASMALALKVIGGLSTREIARAFLLSDASAAQRIVRAKQKIRQAAIPFELPTTDVLPARLERVRQVIYLIFNEGYAATEHAELIRPDLCREAIRLASLLRELLPADAEGLGLLALLELTDARRLARVSDAGELLTLEQQDRSLWDRPQIARGEAALQRALQLRRPGPYQLQAAIAALHAEAQRPQDTDWRQILALYRRLLQWQPGPVVELNAAVALGMAEGPAAGLAWLDQLDASGLLEGYHLLPAARAALQARLGQINAARDSYAAALALARQPAEQAFLRARQAELEVGGT
ncbi:MAG: sigma-70 family RNA polymerase sigma factor [Lysobacterales bacterium]